MADDSGDDRLADLRLMRNQLKRRMRSCESDQNYAVMGRLLVDVIAQIEELAGAGSELGRTGLSEFERKLAERKPSKRASRSKSG